jgi:hypothetical protein
MCSKKINHLAWCDDTIVSGKILADILTERSNNKITNKVNRIIHNFNSRIKLISYLKDINSKSSLEHIGSLIINDVKKEIDIKKFDPAIHDHLKNIIMARYRVFLRNINEKN